MNAKNNWYDSHGCQDHNAAEAYIAELEAELAEAKDQRDYSYSARDEIEAERDQLITVIENAGKQKLSTGAYEHGWRDAVRWINQALKQEDV